MSDVVEHKRSRLSVGLVFRITVTLGILGYLIFTQDWGKIFAIVRTADPGWILAATLVVGVILATAALRLWVILRVQRIHVPWSRLFGLNLIGQFFNAFLPGATGGDVIRVYYLIRQEPERKALVTLSVVMDRVFGLAALLMVTALVLPSQLHVLDRDPNTRQISFFLYLILAVGAVAGLISLYAPIHHLPDIFHRWWLKVPRHEVIAEVFHGGRAYGKNLTLSLTALVLGCAIHLMNFTAGWFIMRALGLEIGLISAVVMVAIIVTAMSLPISISGHGIREAMFILLFSLYGLTGDEAGMRGSEYAVATAFLYFARDLVWSIIGGLVYLGWSHHRKTDPAVS